MGKVINLKAHKNDMVHVTLELSNNEILKLKGNLESMHLFSENILESETKLFQRGRRESTKYFLLPKEFRKGVIPNKNVKCTRLDTKNSHFFIFSVTRFSATNFVSSE